MTTERDNSIDILRAVCMILIILAHVNAPYTLSQLRSFDVPLIVLISGFCYSAKLKSYGQYVITRFKRLYSSTFKFLTVFLSPFIILNLLGFRIPWSWNQIFGSYLLLDEPSIGFVWIIRVFLLMALISPIIFKLVKRINIWGLFASIAGLLTLNEIFIYYYKSSNIFSDFIIEDILMYIIGYLPLLILGMNFRQNKPNTSLVAWLSMLFLTLWISYSLYTTGELDISKSFKYPPHSWYVIYGLAVSILLFNYRYLISKALSPINKFLSFISINSMWVYLWHIPFVYAINHVLIGENFWSLRWIIVLMGGCITTVIQNIVAQRISNYRKLKNPDLI